MSPVKELGREILEYGFNLLGGSGIGRIVP